MSIADNIHKVFTDITTAAQNVGRDSSKITIVAVSKTRSVKEITEAVEAGVLHVGENRVQEASLKIPHVSRNAVWHMVGHLQSNKAKTAVELFDWIDSVDSRKTADIISVRALKINKTVDVLIQVNVSGEVSKSGIPPDETKNLIAYAVCKQRLRVRGLMTLGSFGVAPEVTRNEFSRMKKLFDSLRNDPDVGAQLSVLSMGMSGDFQIAIEEGSTMIRVGTAIFGERT